MKKYIISRIKMTVQAIIIICLVFLVQKNSYTNTTLNVAMNTNLTKVLDSTIIKNSQESLYNESIFNPLFTFVGELTGYSGDCPLCTGYLACPPRTNVIKEGILYKDKTYGTVRIVASSKNYPCGTIVQFNVKKLSDEPITAIILDRGVSGNVIDLLTESGDYAIKSVGRVRNLEFKVLRNGWN